MNNEDALKIVKKYKKVIEDILHIDSLPIIWRITTYTKFFAWTSFPNDESKYFIIRICPSKCKTERDVIDTMYHEGLHILLHMLYPHLNEETLDASHDIEELCVRVLEGVFHDSNGHNLIKRLAKGKTK